MATISFQSASTTSGTLTKTVTLSEADHTRFVNALKFAFGVATPALALAAWVDDIINRAKGTIQDSERTQPNPPIATT